MQFWKALVFLEISVFSYAVPQLRTFLPATVLRYALPFSMLSLFLHWSLSTFVSFCLEHFPQIFICLLPTLYSSVYSNITFSLRPSFIPLFEIETATPTLPSPLPWMSNVKWYFYRFGQWKNLNYIYPPSRLTCECDWYFYLSFFALEDIVALILYRQYSFRFTDIFIITHMYLSVLFFPSCTCDCLSGMIFLLAEAYSLIFPFIVSLLMMNSSCLCRKVLFYLHP